MKKAWITLFLVLPLLISCSNEDSARNTLTGSAGYADADPVVQSADGSMYSVGCLQQNASAVKQKGAITIQTCQVSTQAGAVTADSSQRGKFFRNSFAYVYYPPTYQNPNYYTTYSYGSGYDCTNDSNFKKNDDFFCSWLFGKNSGINCYYLFGFISASKYSSYYNPTCNNCLYSYDQSVCESRCYHQMPVTYY